MFDFRRPGEAGDEEEEEEEEIEPMEGLFCCLLLAWCAVSRRPELG